jgi:hypothetical protein
LAWQIAVYRRVGRRIYLLNQPPCTLHIDIGKEKIILTFEIALLEITAVHERRIDGPTGHPVQWYEKKRDKQKMVGAE